MIGLVLEISVLKNMTTITLELPQSIYDSVQKAAARAGQFPQELITRC